MSTQTLEIPQKSDQDFESDLIHIQHNHRRTHTYCGLKIAEQWEQIDDLGEDTPDTCIVCADLWRLDVH